ncbi:MAG TPA: putative zinc-binding protein [Phycisphaerae bacterium]|nr:putative zinc-binding protein [Phycisphaerae bacterium]HRR86576.1 putative zinc-binding protein [Phycisphaerae bacterium]
MTDQTGCACGAAPTLIFACSGAADVGEIADRAARRLAREGAGKMYCLAGVGGRVSGILASTQAAEQILAIDGCPLACAKKSLEHAGISRFKYVQLADLGMTKGESPATDDRIAQAATAGIAALS